MVADTSLCHSFAPRAQASPPPGKGKSRRSLARDSSQFLAGQHIIIC
jgi:hypothetical protein